MFSQKSYCPISSIINPKNHRYAKNRIRIREVFVFNTELPEHYNEWEAIKALKESGFDPIGLPNYDIRQAFFKLKIWIRFPQKTMDFVIFAMFSKIVAL